MEQRFTIEGMHCQGCVTRARQALAPLGDEVTVTLDPPEAVIEGADAVSLEQVQAALSRVGSYTARAV
jgi:copper chaperone CopZ